MVLTLFLRSAPLEPDEAAGLKLEGKTGTDDTASGVSEAADALSRPPVARPGIV